MIKLIRNSNFKKMPWKNGQGMTIQILIEPDESELIKNNFHFRFSSAPIDKEGEFSLFPGMERILIPIKGAGFQLNEHVFEKFEVAQFSGSDKTYCHLLKGPVIDFGIIFNPQLAEVSIKVLQLKTDLQFTLDQQHKYFVTILDGNLIFADQKLEPLETICFENESLCKLSVSRSAVLAFTTVKSHTHK